MRNVIFGGIGTVWGLGILIYSIAKEGPEGQGAYGGGQIAGLVLGVLLFGVGAFYLIPAPMELKEEKEERSEKKKRPRRSRRGSMSMVRLLIWAMVFSALICTGHGRLPRLDPLSATLANDPGITPQGNIDLVAKRLPRIPPGTIISAGPPAGWSHLVLFANPGLGAGDFQGIPKVVLDYAKWLKFTILANVGKHKVAGKESYYLDRVARGFAVGIPDKKTDKIKETIIETGQTLDADMGIMGARVLKENEDILDNEVRQVVRTDTMLIFDANSYMLYNNKHERMVNRYAILVLPDSGRLATVVWLLAFDGPGKYKAAEPAMQLLPPSMHESRLLSAKREKFKLVLLVYVPEPDAFALMSIPQGNAIAYTPQLQDAATVKEFTPKQVQDLEMKLRTAVLEQ